MDNKKTLYIAAGVVVVAIIAYAIYANNRKADNSANSYNQQTQNQTSAANSTAASASPAAPAKLSYGAAINAYKFRFQFSQCHASPGFLSVKINTPVMLDNRDKVAHTIKADGQSVRIAADDYAVIYPKLPTGATANLADSNMTCDGGGAGVLNVEK